MCMRRILYNIHTYLYTHMYTDIQQHGRAIETQRKLEEKREGSVPLHYCLSA